MGAASGIEWTDSTFNPWIGCTKISPACDNCYAESWAERFNEDVWGKSPRRRTSEKNWNNPRRWQRDADKWFAEHGRGRFVFCASLADVFDNQVPEEWRADLWSLIKECDRLTWLLLTKRPQNIEKMLPPDWGAGYPNVWLGTTVENQEVADRNIPHLLAAPSAKRFLSIEPIVGPIELGGASGIDWVIAGGESGPNARPANPDWYRSLRNQSYAAGVPFHFKQWGEWLPYGFVDAHGRENTRTRGEKPGLWVNDEKFGQQVRVGKKEAGRLLDGRTWDERPEGVK